MDELKFMSTGIILTSVPVPLYLSCFERKHHDIHLIYAKKPSITSDNEIYSPIKNEPVHEDSTNETIEECDLTGHPLKVDLGEDDTIEINNVEPTAPFWRNEEKRHFPITIREARRELNGILKNPNLSPSFPIYVVCDGNDPRHTVLLGADKESLMACGVHALGCIEVKDDEIETDEMVNDHYQNCNRTDIEVKYLVEISYNVYGKTLRNLPCQNATMRDMEKHASVSVNVTSHQRVFKVLGNTKLSMVMNLELIAGHRLLRLNFLWKELQTLQTFMDILLDRNLGLNEDTILCDDPLNPDVILQEISTMVKTKFLRSPPTKDLIDLDNLRQEDFLDRIFNILKRCESISVLRDSFHFLFEELANGDIQVTNIKDKFSSIAFIINGILKKNIVLSAITLPQCVELLFELGAQKVKFDFQVILEHFNNMAKNNIESVWKTFYQTKEQETRKTIKATRVTQFLNTSNLVVKTKQLAYLCQMYVASEFIFLVKEQVYLQNDIFYSFCQHVRKLYVENSILEDFLEIYQSPLCKMSFTFDITDIGIIKSVSPSRWTMHMNSEVGSTQVTTIYDLSEYPIFPPNIYNYDVPITNKSMVYFMSKMNRTEDLPK